MRFRYALLCLTATALAGCVGNLPFGGDAVDPLDDVERLSDVTLATDAETVAIAAPVDDGGPGFFGRLLGRNTAPDTDVDAALAEAVSDQDASTPSTEGLASASTEDATEVATAAAPQRSGLFGFLRRDDTADGNGATEAAAPPVDPDQVAPMTMQAFGDVGKTCGLGRRDLGTEVASVSGFKIYDTAPNTTAARPHYITGFNDRCARQFTAALVLTGDVGTHEVVRYQGSGRNLPYTQSDEAYEGIKGRFCGVGRGQPCGGRLDALARRTTFVTAYQTFATSPVWADILLHNGEFIAASVESRN